MSDVRSEALVGSQHCNDSFMMTKSLQTCGGCGSQDGHFKLKHETCSKEYNTCLSEGNNVKKRLHTLRPCAH